MSPLNSFPSLVAEVSNAKQEEVWSKGPSKPQELNPAKNLGEPASGFTFSRWEPRLLTLESSLRLWGRLCQACVDFCEIWNGYLNLWRCAMQQWKMNTVFKRWRFPLVWVIFLSKCMSKVLLAYPISRPQQEFLCQRSVCTGSLLTKTRRILVIFLKELLEWDCRSRIQVVYKESFSWDYYFILI